MTDHDLIITHKDLFDQQAHDLLAIENVESMQRSAEPAEECGERFGETEIGSAVGRLIGDRLQFAARGLFTLAQRPDHQQVNQYHKEHHKADQC